MIVGIDYGSKLAGTTVIAFENEGEITLMSSKKNQDADRMILDFVDEYNPKLIGLDAPLSLPGVYSNPERFDDYFYRLADKEVSAMSPMFLGGLTARAMKLKSLIGAKTEVIEVYPSMRAKSLNLSEFAYKKKGADYSKMLKRILDTSELPDLKTSHELDAILALQIALAFRRGNAVDVGTVEEGIIYY